MTVAAPFVLEVFSCSGGMALGLRRAGLMPSMAFDYDEDACLSYEANLGHAPVRIDVRDLMRMVEAGWRPKSPVDLLVADPPCTPWSRAGKRQGTEDERDMLEWTVKLVALLAPRAFLIANVPGLDDGPNWPVVQRLIGGLAPRWCVEFARLDAADYGVPQHRIRSFWFGHAWGIAMRWPERTHGSPSELRNQVIDGISPLRPWVTCRDALSHLSPEDLGSPVKLRWRGQNGSQNGSIIDAPARVVCTTSLGDGNVIVTGPNHRVSTGDALARTLTRNTHSDGALLVNSKHPINRSEEPSFTITSKGKSFLSSPNAIKLSEKAAAILQGFPEHWRFVGKTKRSRWSQIGMAMPPPLADAVGRSIARSLAEQAVRP